MRLIIEIETRDEKDDVTFLCLVIQKIKKLTEYQERLENITLIIIIAIN
jgi:cell division protein ZapA (FtsZ GTPase activity inhibitor)